MEQDKIEEDSSTRFFFPSSFFLNLIREKKGNVLNFKIREP
jgi:hypothetical protein